MIHTLSPSPSEHFLLILVLLSKTNPLVPVIKDGIKLAHEDITQDPLRTRRDIHSHHGKQACAGSLNHKVLSRHSKCLPVDVEFEVREGRHLGTVDSVFSHKVGHGADGHGNPHDSHGRSGYQRGARVYDTVCGAGRIRASDDIFNVDLPVFGLGEWNPVDVTLEFRVVCEMPSKHIFCVRICNQKIIKLTLVETHHIHQTSTLRPCCLPSQKQTQAELLDPDQ